MASRSILGVVQAKGLPEWSFSVAEDATVSVVLDGFCNTYCLRKEDCFLGSLHDNYSRIESTLLVQDVPPARIFKRNANSGSEEQRVFRAIFQTTLASYAWSTLNTFYVFDGTAVYADWAVHLGVICLEDERFTNLFTDEHMLSGFLDASPQETLPLDVAVNPCKLSSVQNVRQAVQPLILLLQELISNRSKDSLEDEISKSEGGKQRKRGKAAPQPSTDPTVPLTQHGRRHPQQAASAKAQCGHVVMLLRSMILPFKLLKMLQHITASNTSNISTIKEALIRTLVTLAQFLKQHVGTGCYNKAVCPQSQREASIESEEAERLSATVVRLMLPHMKQAITGRVSARCEWYPDLLLAILQTPSPLVFKAAAADLIKPGALALLAACMDSTNNKAADSAGMVVAELICSPGLPPMERAKTALLFAQMQGMRRFSMLLCPFATQPELQELPEGLLEYFPAEVMKDRLVKKPTMKQIKDDVFESHLLSLMLLLDVLDRLLTAKSPYVNQAFSVRFPGQHSSSCQTSCQCKLHLTLNALEQVSVSIDINRGGAAQTSADAEVLQPITSAQQENAASASAWWDLNWPTPTDAEWIIIEQVLGRCILLLKLFSLPRRKRRFPNECRELKQALLNLACKLLSGHISNLRLDMKRVFQLTFPVVLREMAAQSADNSKDAPIWLLGTVLMQRLALDPNILRSGNLGDLGPDFTDPMLGMLMMTLFDSRSDGDPAVAAALEEVMYMLSSSTEQCKAWIAGISWESAAVHSLPFDLQPDEQAAGRLTSMAFLARILTVATQDSDVAAKPLQSLCASGMVPHYIIAAATMDGWTLPIFRGFIRLLWTSCELYRTCPQILRQLEVEVLQAVGITVQSVLDWNDPFLQSRMLQACVSFASALLDAPGVTADCRLKAIAQSIVTAAPQVVDHITKPVASWEHYPACLGLPDLSMSQMHNVSLMLLARLYQPAGLDASAKVQALNTWLSSWQLELDKSITVFCKKLVGPTTRSEPVHVSIPKETKGFIGMMLATFSGQGHDDKVSPYKEVALKALRALHWSLAITTVSLSMLHLTSEAVQHSAAAKSPAAQTSPSKAKQQLAEQASSEASAEVSATAALFKTDAAHSKLKAEIDETHSVIDVMVEALRVLEKDQYWVPLLAEGGRCVWCQDREKAEVEKVSAFVRKCLALLASHKWLPLELCVFIEDRLLCSDTVAQVPVQVPVASHAEQLIAEEHEAAARAAAKKAKKQRQKANKQQAQVSIAIVNAASTELPVQPEEEQNSSLASVASTGPDEAAASTSAPAGSTPDAEAQPEQAATALEASFASATPLHGDDQFVDASPVAVEEVQLETAAKHMPSLFICPLTKAVMVDAVLAGDGWCYERTAMEQWLQTEDTSPKTGAVLPHKRLVPNITVRKLIALYLQQPPQ